MDDKELLELAAHAAGLQVQRSRLDDPLDRDFLIKGEGPRNEGQAAYPWNPLTDDGDALRLAVKLCMGVIHNDPRGQRLYVSADASRFVDPIFEAFTATEEFDAEDDRPVATRRAIVRAAAEIARQESSHDS